MDWGGNKKTGVTNDKGMNTIEYMLGLDVLPVILNILATNDYTIKEKIKCILKLAERGSPKQIMKLIENGFEPIARGLRGLESNIDRHKWEVKNMLDVMIRVLSTAKEDFNDSYPAILKDFEESGCLDSVKRFNCQNWIVSIGHLFPFSTLNPTQPDESLKGDVIF
uniref:ANK_REP_REGION domain-containing protein n=1 Tax=Steinernema glaseri TaxID=37863 RepID=A0A1I7Y8J8_9BILA